MTLLRTEARRRIHLLTLLGATSLIASLAARDASAFEIKRTSSGDLVHWDESTVDYTFDPSIETSVPSAIDAATRAMGSWSGTVGAPELKGHAASTVASPPTKPGFDSKNGVFFMPNGYAPAGKALAITVLTFDNASGRILDADIIVNGRYAFAVLPASSTPTAPADASPVHPSTTDGVAHADEGESGNAVYDLHHVLAHELGHSLGMNDELVSDKALMYKYSAPYDATVRAPEIDDIEGLAQLYGTKIEAGGNGCGSAAIAPKKPSFAASQLAMFGTLGFLAFLVLRGRGDRRARLAFVAAAAVATYGLLPTVSKIDSGIAHASGPLQGHARGKVVSAAVTMEDGLLKTTYQLATTECHVRSCPERAAGVAWGGTAGTIRQEVGGQFAPASGDDVDVSFDHLPDALAPLASPVASTTTLLAKVRVLTKAR